ncbi:MULTISPECIES: hypothetical protein [Protofrankia]|uniref:Uncharacterized protein n=1 Tax=Candidatus Protofrankia datiscae TaxID=2716812 RepID=F8B433_9ACTN|nr:MULTISPECIES: hypothetical protein [Protofrankia]AEH10054.1 hypothetical protein FsymDg_2705 [Candidatus Protofrankia datiscae]
MTLDGLSTLSGVRAFLTAKILPAVPGELAGELRATVKLLETVETELNDRHLLLIAETWDLIAYCERIGRLLELADTTNGCTELAARVVASASLNLTEVGELWRDARALSSARLVAVQRYASDPSTSEPGRVAARYLLRRFYSCLGGHARRRQAWQAVFPPAAGAPAPRSHSEGADQ